MKRTKAILMIGVITVMLFALTGCGKTTIKLDKYVTITSEGYDSMGTASYDFDYDAFVKDYSGKIKLSKNSSELSGWGLLTSETLEELLLDCCVDQKLDKTSDLSNGDVVTLKWNCEDTMAEEYFNVKLHYSDIIYTVKGLKEVGTFNPFDHLTIAPDGIAPNGSVSLNPNYDKSEMQYITFSSSKNSGLSNGDTITITADIQGSKDSFVSNYGVILSPTEMEYTVNGLKSYATSAVSIPEDTMSKMVNQGKDVFMSEIATSWIDGYEIKSIDYLGNYFMTLKEGQSGDNNYLYLVYKIDFIEIDGNEYKFYYQVKFKNIITDGNGNCLVDLSDYEKTSDTFEYADGKYNALGYNTVDSLYETVIQPEVERYTCEKNINN